MPPLDLIILITATLYVAYAVGWSHGPFHIFSRFRNRFPLGGASRCTFCLSVWAAGALYALWQTPLQPIVIVFSIAGGAVALATYTGVGDE